MNFKQFKHMFSKKRMRSIQKNAISVAKRGAIPTALIVIILAGSLIYKKPAQALFGNNDNAAGNILGTTITGTAIGGLAGGRKGAGIGAAAGLGLGLITSAAQSSGTGSNPYSKLDQLERQRDRLQDNVANYRNQLGSTSEKKQIRIQRKLQQTERRLNQKDQEIARVKQNLGVRE